MATDEFGVSQASKFLALILRHQPEQYGIELDAQGWTDIDKLLDALHAHGVELTRAELDQLVASSDDPGKPPTGGKQRFAISTDGARIRANQGHSVQVELNLDTLAPPDVLYHGTVERNLAGI